MLRVEISAVILKKNKIIKYEVTSDNEVYIYDRQMILDSEREYDAMKEKC